MNNNIGCCCCCCRDNQNFRFGQLSKPFESGDVMKYNKKRPWLLINGRISKAWMILSVDSPAVIFFTILRSRDFSQFSKKKKAQRGSEAERQKRAWATHTHTHASRDLDIKAKPDRDNTRAPKNEKKKQSGIKNDVTTFSAVICLWRRHRTQKEEKLEHPPPYSFRLGKDFFCVFHVSKKWAIAHSRQKKNSTADRMATVLCRGSSPFGCLTEHAILFKQIKCYISFI